MRNNLNLESNYHPGVFEDGRWSCCLNKTKQGCGCVPTFINPQRSTRPQLPPLPTTPTTAIGRPPSHELLQKRSVSNPTPTMNGAVGTGKFKWNISCISNTAVILNAVVLLARIIRLIRSSSHDTLNVSPKQNTVVSA